MSVSCADGHIPYYPHTFDAREIQSYQPLPSGSKIDRVLIFLRHGDRSPWNDNLGPNSPRSDTLEEFWKSSVPLDTCQRLAQLGTTLYNKGTDLFDDYDFQSKYLNCEKFPFGELTKQGFDQLYNLGAVIKKLYFKDEAIPCEYWRDKVYCRSTVKNRTQFSLRSFVAGMQGKLIDTDSCSSMFPMIYSYNDDNDPICISKKHKKDYPLKDAHKQACIEQVEAEMPCLGIVDNKFRAIFGYEPGEKVDRRRLKDVLTCFEANGLQLPKYITNDDIQYVTHLICKLFRREYENEEYLRSQNGYLFHHVAATIKDNRKHHPNSHFEYVPDTSVDLSRFPDMHIFSGHSSAIIFLQYCFNIFEYTWPGYSAYLAFEIFSMESKPTEKFVRMIYNHKAVPFVSKIDPNALDPYNMPYELFMSRLEEMSFYA